MVVLDTHAAIWFVTDTGLGRTSRRIVGRALNEDRLALSAISFWEIALLIAKRRVRALSAAGEQRIKVLNAGIRELPITGEIAILAVELDGLHPDPADRLIAATAITHDAMLLTADQRLLHWRHKLRRQNAEL